MRFHEVICESVPAWLRQDFYHGTARRKLDFSATHVGYFTPNLHHAWEYAEMDAEVDGGIPVVLRVRLNLRNPVRLDTMEMQDLHYKHELVAQLQAAGHDGAIGEHDNEVAVFGSAPVQVLEVMRKTVQEAVQTGGGALNETSQYRLNPSTGDFEINFDPQTITSDEFNTMVAFLKDNRRYATNYIINGATFNSYEDAIRKLLMLLQPRIDAYRQRQEEKRTAWSRANPQLVNYVELVPTAWLARLRGNDLRDDVAELMADIDRQGVLWPINIIVGKIDRHARIGEGNHRIEAARRLGLEELPAMVHVYRNGRGAQHYSHDVSDDLLIPADGYVPAEMKPSQVFRSLERS